MKQALVVRIKRIGKIGGAVSAAAVTIITPLWLLVQDVRGTAEGAKRGAETGYETLAPAVAENQQDIQEGLQALADLGNRVGEFRQQRQKEISLLQQRMTRCETYIEVLSRGRFSPTSTPVKADPVREAARTAANLKEAFTEQPQDVAAQIRSREKVPVPNSLEDAKAYQKVRKKVMGK